MGVSIKVKVICDRGGCSRYTETGFRTGRVQTALEMFIRRGWQVGGVKIADHPPRSLCPTHRIEEAAGTGTTPGTNTRPPADTRDWPSVAETEERARLAREAERRMVGPAS